MIHFENRDCMDAMKEFPDKFFDLAIVDPPYGIGEDGSKNKTRGTKNAPAKDFHPFFGNDKHPPDKAYFAELFRVSKNQVVFGANHFIERMPRNSHCWIVWDKQNDPTDFADAELAWTSFGGGGSDISVQMEWDVTRKHERQRNANPSDTKARCALQVDFEPICKGRNENP